MSVTSDGGFLLTGTHVQISGVEQYQIVMKLNSRGQLEKVTRIGESIYNHGYFAQEAPDGGVIALMEKMNANSKQTV